MDNIRSLNFIYESQCLQTRVQNIAVDMDRSPTTHEKYCDVTHQLSETYKDLQNIKAQTTTVIFAKGVLESLESEIITLCGRATSSWMQNEVAEIQREATFIDNETKSGQVTAEAVQALVCRLEIFKHDHRPSAQERRLIADAECIVARARAFLNGEPIEDVQRPPPLDRGAFGELSNINLCEMEELMEIASHIYHRDFRQAKMKYLQLPEVYKKRFLEHMEFLKATPFTDPLESIRAFIAVVNELVNNGEGYLSSAQIDELFFEESQVYLEEADDKIFSLRSRESRNG